MATVSLVLPTHCHVKRRDNYQDVYFIIHKDVRPEGWPATIFVGRIGRESPHDIITKGNQINVDYENFAANRSGQQRIDQLLGTFPHIVRLYKESPFFLDLGMQSRETYTYSLERILEWSEENDHPHIKFFTVAVASKFLQKFDHAPFAQRSYKKVLSRLCTIAVQEGFLQGNPMRDVVLRRKPKSGRQIRLWTDEKMLQFAKEADGLGFPSMADILYVGCDLSQRLSDILPMEQHVDYVDGVFYFLQNKTGVQVNIPATRFIKERLARIPKDQKYLFAKDGTDAPWKRTDFNYRFRFIADRCGLQGFIFQQGRHSAINKLKQAGCTAELISPVTGHGIKSTANMIDKHYGVDRDEQLAHQAIQKLEEARDAKRT